MRCDCGYEGIPNRHDDAPGSPWKCPACQTPRPVPLRHDPMPDEVQGDLVCSQCGMRGRTRDDLWTPCPGHSADHGLGVYGCPCGEWEPIPKPPQKTIFCRRCGYEHPERLRADYVPPEPKRRRG
jgi:hypothetical protein